MSTLDALRALGLTQGSIRALEKKARRHGRTAPQYVRDLIDGDLLAEKSFDEILAPVREGFRKSGMTEAELDALVQRARKSVRRGSRR